MKFLVEYKRLPQDTVSFRSRSVEANTASEAAEAFVREYNTDHKAFLSRVVLVKNEESPFAIWRSFSVVCSWQPTYITTESEVGV
jgi:hypothetical protein